jgi:hypothetical protein
LLTGLQARKAQQTECRPSFINGLTAVIAGSHAQQAPQGRILLCSSLFRVPAPRFRHAPRLQQPGDQLVGGGAGKVLCKKKSASGEKEGTL